MMTRSVVNGQLGGSIVIETTEPFRVALADCGAHIANSPITCATTGISDVGFGGSKRMFAAEAAPAKRKRNSAIGARMRAIRMRFSRRLIRRLYLIVRRFLRNHHVVRVRLAQSGGRDANELRFGAQIFDVS